jgi:trimeric autotransporter adhesin
MAGYTRNDTLNNIADGNVISAADLDGEFDALDAAFDEATGHVHDGTANNGAPITKVGPAQDLVVSTGAVTPKTDNAVDLGTSSFEFKDLYIDGTANIDSLVADTADINAGTIDGVTLGTNSAVTQAQIDNININGNAIITTDTNGNLALTPNGTGEVDISKVDIDSGTIDGTTIGGASAAAGTFTNLTASGTVNFTGATVSNGGTFTTIDINGGSIDGVTIGTNSAVTDLRVDNLQLNGNTISSTDTNGNIAITPNGTGEVDISKVDIDSGAIDGTTIGGASAAAGTFTNLTATGTVTIPDNAISGDKVEGGTINATTITTLTSTTGNITTVNATTVDATNIEVTNIKAKDGTASASIADSTGVFSHATTTVFPAGAVGTPAITTTGDTNTGIFFPAADTIAFAEGGAEAMRIDSSGNVGIGTSSPQYRLHVKAGSGLDYRNLAWFQGEGTNVAPQFERAVALGASNSGAHIDGWNGTSGSRGGTSLLLQSDGGNVGIGTSSPANRLQVESVGSSASEIAMRLRNGAALSDATVELLFQGGYGSSSTEGTSSIRGGRSGGGNASYLAFTTSAGGGTLTERARITSGGDFLVGTTTTSYGTIGGRFISASPTSGSAGVFYTGFSGDISTSALNVGKFDNNNTTSQVFMKFGINNAGLGCGQINGNGASQAAFGSFSDRRLKENIVDLEPQLANICALRPVEFDYVESEGGGHQIGFVAQEIQEIYPDVVGERSDGMLTLSGFNKTEARLIKAIQELKAELDTVKAELATLKG